MSIWQDHVCNNLLATTKPNTMGLSGSKRDFSDHSPAISMGTITLLWRRSSHVYTYITLNLSQLAKLTSGFTSSCMPELISPCEESCRSCSRPSINFCRTQMEEPDCSLPTNRMTSRDGRIAIIVCPFRANTAQHEIHC